MGRLVPLRRDIRQAIVRQSLKTSENIHFRKSLPRLLGSVSANQERSQSTCHWPTGDTEVGGYANSQADSRPTDQSHPLTQLSEGPLMPTKSWAKMGNDCRSHNCVYKVPIQDLPWSDLPGRALLDHGASQTFLTLTCREEYIYPVCVCLCVWWWYTCGTVYLRRSENSLQESILSFYRMASEKLTQVTSLVASALPCWTVLIALKPRFWKSKLCLQWPIKRRTDNRTCYSHMKTEEDARTKPDCHPQQPNLPLLRDLFWYFSSLENIVMGISRYIL